MKSLCIGVFAFVLLNQTAQAQQSSPTEKAINTVACQTQARLEEMIRLLYVAPRHNPRQALLKVNENSNDCVVGYIGIKDYESFPKKVPLSRFPITLESEGDGEARVIKAVVTWWGLGGPAEAFDPPIERFVLYLYGYRRPSTEN